ncbi:hypothetical protein ACP70R_005241 [Stipagrostis hirtigluma subsp. patula]
MFHSSHKRPAPNLFHQEHNDEISSSTLLHRLVYVLQNLSDKQKDIVTDIGFSSILPFRCSYVPLDLYHWLLHHFDEDSKTLVLPNGFSFTLNSRCVHKLTGIPYGGTEIRCSGSLETYEFIRCRIQSKGRTPSVDELCAMISSDLTDAQFARIFMLLVLSTFLCPNTRGVCSTRYYSALVCVSSIRDCDWSSFTLDWFISYVKKYKASKQKTNSSLTGGCGLILVMSYFEFLCTPEYYFGNVCPRLNIWTTTTVQTFSLLDSLPGCSTSFGRLPLKHICCTIFKDCFFSSNSCLPLPEDILQAMKQIIDPSSFDAVVSKLSEMTANVWNNLPESLVHKSRTEISTYIQNVLRLLCSELSAASTSLQPKKKTTFTVIDETDSDCDDADIHVKHFPKRSKTHKCANSRCDHISHETMQHILRYFEPIPLPEFCSQQDDEPIEAAVFQDMLSHYIPIQSDSELQFLDVHLPYEHLYIKSLEMKGQSKNNEIQDELVPDILTLAEEPRLNLVKVREKHEDTSFIDALIQSLPSETQNDSNSGQIYDSAGYLIVPEDKSKSFGLSKNLPIANNFGCTRLQDANFPNFDILGDLSGDESENKESLLDDSLVKGLQLQFRRCSEMINRETVKPPSEKKLMHDRSAPVKQVLFATEQEQYFHSLITSSITKEDSCHKIVKIGKTWVDQRILALSMMPGGWIHFLVMDAFCKMFQHYEENIDRMNNRYAGQICHQYFFHDTSALLMNPTLEHNSYKKDFLQIIGFKLENAGMLHIPCYVDKQWFLVIVNFNSKRFDVLNPEFNIENMKHTVNSVIHNFTKFFLRCYPGCKEYNITEFPVNYVDVPKFNFKYDSGIFVIEFLQSYNGTTVVPISNVDIVPLRQKFLFQICTYVGNNGSAPALQNLLQH